MQQIKVIGEKPRLQLLCIIKCLSFDKFKPAQVQTVEQLACTVQQIMSTL